MAVASVAVLAGPAAVAAGLTTRGGLPPPSNSTRSAAGREPHAGPSAPAPISPAATGRTAALGRLATTGPVGPKPPPATPQDAFSSTTRVLIPVEVQSQLPALPNGCEATSLSMLLSAVSAPVDKQVLAREQQTDPGQPIFSGVRGDLTRIASWGDPEKNFVGRVTGRYGYGVYHAPLARLLDRKVPGRALDLTGGSFQDVLRQVDSGNPVMLWNTTTLSPTERWVTWSGPSGPVRATFKEHAVLLVGHTATALIINNPLTGRRETVAPGPFIAAWRQLGRQALTVRRA